MTSQYEQLPRSAPAVTAEPGWHPDPGYPKYLRYWDGTGWTAHTYKIPRDKRVWVAYLLFLLLGGLAAHRFYLRRPVSAVGFIVLYWIGVAGTTAVIESVRTSA
ncbi:MAG TPA: DUF2510 domain-containing protein, partial [Microbacterium sp.]|uniref:DUF2510 domain-containing protein n=1 Tax=Microbacterium sp. TaxID=51671 RepID=UPI002CD0ECE3